MKGFLSYAHQNDAECKTFRTHITALRRAFDIDTWTDHRILGGTAWETSIEEAIDAADVFFLLISPAFVDSEYVYTQELPAIIRRRRTDNALVLPVVLARCSWQIIAGQLQAMPSKAGKLTPITNWRPHNDGYDQARTEMQQTIASHFNMTPKHVQW